jgi:predicted GTPase
MIERQNILILGAAGKDFHTFNTCFRGSAAYRVVAFTATQIPDIAGRRYPPELAGDGYPEGIEILDEADLERIIREREVARVVFAYSDVSFDYVAEREQRATAAGAAFEVAPVDEVMLVSSRPVVAVTAVRTGCGKSQTTRRAAEILREKGKKVVVVRHPMPYGDLTEQRLQRFAEVADLAKHDCTIEEMEEYEPHLVRGTIVYAGIDYEAILREAEKEADVVLWDGGNNDTPFYRPDLWICVADALRPGHELTYYPGRTNFERADAIVINKIDSADEAAVAQITDNAQRLNPGATIVRATSPVTVDDPTVITGRRVIAIEDGPTCTHGGMRTGAATVAAERFGAAEIVDPRPFAVGSIADTFARYPDIGALLPAMGYGRKQMTELAQTLERADVDAIVIGTPIDLRRVIDIRKPSTRVRYDLVEQGEPDLVRVLEAV